MEGGCYRGGPLRDGTDVLIIIVVVIISVAVKG